MADGDPSQGAKQSHKRPGRPSISNEELLDKALDLFLAHGFERTSIDAIAAAAGIAKRTLYARYPDKESLFGAALERAIENWIVPVEELRAAERAGLEATLLNIGRILVSNVMTPEGLRLLRITNAESGRLPRFGAYTYDATTAPTIAYLADLFKRRLGAADSPEPPTRWSETALAFLYLVVAGPPTMTAWGLELDAGAVERHTEFSVRLFLYGVLPREAAGLRPGSLVLPEVRAVLDDDGSDGSEVLNREQLQAENRRLKKLLISALLDSAALREQLESK